MGEKQMPRSHEILLVGLLLVATMQTVSQTKKCFARVDAQGSLPPLPQLFGCVRDLNGKAYQAASAKSCLDTILASGYLESGHIEVESGGSNVIVHFVLKAPSLVVQDIEFDVEEPLKQPMLAWIKKTGDTLRSGDIYRTDRDDKTREVLGFYFRDIGKNAGVTRVANIDYQARTAKLTYRVAVGPDIIPIRALAPYEKACKEPVAMFNLTDVDDYTPVNLIEKMTKTHAFGCFSTAAISEDERGLRDSKLFKGVRYDVHGDPDNRQVYLHVEGKPLEVREVKVVGYGLLFGQSFASNAALALRPGTPYKRSLANRSQEYLEKERAGANRIVDVTEDDRLTSNNELIVTFNVLAYEQDRVTINGQEFRIAPVTVVVHS
jgi:hypothetical protein